MKKKNLALIALLACLTFGLQTTAAFADVRPSVSYKEQPEVIVEEKEVPVEGGQSGETELIEYSAIIIDQEIVAETDEDKTIDYVRVTHVNINSYSQIQNETATGLTPDQIATKKTAMTTAYEELSDTAKNKQLAGLMKETAKSYKLFYSETNLVTTHLFDIELYNDDLSLLRSNEAYRAVIRFNIGIDADAQMVVFHKVESTNQWVRVPAKDVVNNGDGTLTVRFEDLCPVVFMEVNGNVNPFGLPFSSTELYLLFMLLVIVLLIILILVTAFKKNPPVVKLITEREKAAFGLLADDDDKDDDEEKPAEKEEKKKAEEKPAEKEKKPAKKAPAKKSSSKKPAEKKEVAKKSEKPAKKAKKKTAEKKAGKAPAKKAEEKPAKKAVAAVAVASAPVEAEEGEDEGSPFDKLSKGPSKTFAERLKEASPELKARYKELSEELLSYKKVNARMSKKCETYNAGRNILAKFAIVGKTLRLFLSIDPTCVDVNIFHQKDASDKKAYADVPFRMDVKSDLGVRRSKNLIEAMMAEYEVVRK